MKRLLLALLLAAVAAQLQARPISEKDLFRFVWVSDPQISPDGRQVAFVRTTVNEKKDTYETSIWSVPAMAGATPRRLTNGPHDSAPRWSRDGKLMAFLRAVEKDGKPQPAQIFVLSLDGSEARAVTSLTRGVESLAWSPVRNTLAFTASTRPADLEKPVKKNEDEHESDVRIINQAVYRANGAGYRDATRASHLWTVNVPDVMGDEPPAAKQLTSGDFSEGDVQWSPDGSKIYFSSTRVYEPYYDVRDNDLYVVSASGGDIARIVSYQGTIGAYAPSPDGKWIAFAGSLTQPIQSYTQPDLFVVSTVPGSAPRNLTANNDTDIPAASAAIRRRRVPAVVRAPCGVPTARASSSVWPSRGESTSSGSTCRAATSSRGPSEITPSPPTPSRVRARWLSSPHRPASAISSWSTRRVR
jgi:Dipeptidyl aminopeptidases/acylaminoacyl-peptidases